MMQFKYGSEQVKRVLTGSDRVWAYLNRLNVVGLSDALIYRSEGVLAQSGDKVWKVILDGLELVQDDISKRPELLIIDSKPIIRFTESTFLEGSNSNSNLLIAL